MRQLIADMREEWLGLDQRIAALDNEFVSHARADADARRLATIPGIGVLNATALLAESATPMPSPVAAISRLGSDWSRVRSRPEEGRVW
jgi:transposase